MIDHRLHVLRLLAHHGTVTATAEALHYTPSAVSAQLRSLSEQLGVTLLVPKGRGVKLTPAGRLLLARADDLYERWEQIRAELVAGADETMVELRMCGFSTAAAALLPPVAARLLRTYPNLDVRIIEAGPAECFDLLLAGEADVAVVAVTQEIPSASDPRFYQQQLLNDPLDLLLSTNHRLAGHESASFQEVATERWIVDRVGRPYHQLFMTACATAGFVPTIAHEVVEWETAAALVGAELGVALIPRLARLPAGYPVVRVPLHGDPRPTRHIITGIRRGSRGLPIVSEAIRTLNDVGPAALAAVQLATDDNGRA